MAASIICPQNSLKDRHSPIRAPKSPAVVPCAGAIAAPLSRRKHSVGGRDRATPLLEFVARRPGGLFFWALQSSGDLMHVKDAPELGQKLPMHFGRAAPRDGRRRRRRRL